MSEHVEQSIWRRYIFSTDHKVIGMQYMLTGIVMAILGGWLSIDFRLQIAFPDMGWLSTGAYNATVTAHGAIMIFWVAMPILIAAFGNFLIPTMIGTDDMAYPTLNMISYWLFLLSAIVLILALLVGGFGGGWTLYPPLSANMLDVTGGGYSNTLMHPDVLPRVFSGGTLFIVAIALELIAFLIGGLNFLVTTINMRAKGMTMWDLPFMVWMLDSAVVVFMFSVGPLVAGAIMLLTDRLVGTGFYDPTKGGDPILFQHLFWFFGHPEVYVILLPALGAIGEVIATFARKALFGMKVLVFMAFAAVGLSFVVWAHHQFVAGINPKVALWFTIGTVLISVPFASMIFSFIATLWRGQIQLTTANLWAIGFILTFIIGGITGIYLGSMASDIIFHDTYFVVAHFHYTLIPITLFGTMTGIYYWYPKFVGRKYSEKFGKTHFWLSFMLFNLAWLPLFIPGTAGQQRRIAGYTVENFPSIAEPFQDIRVFATMCAILLVTVQLVWFFYMIYISFKGEKITDTNPWKANTLEWQCATPPPHGNFAEYPTVYRGPYEYSVPGQDRDYWPQNEPTKQTKEPIGVEK